MKFKRNRNNRVHFRLSDSEYAYLKKHVKTSGLSMAVFLRKSILNQKINAKANGDYPKIVHDMANIANGIYRIAQKSSNISVHDTKLAVILAEKCWDLLKELR